MSEKDKESFLYNFSPKNNGGESLIIKTYFEKEDGKVLIAGQKLELHSYCNSAQLNLVGTILTPDKLRELADKIEMKKNSFAASGT